MNGRTVAVVALAGAVVLCACWLGAVEGAGGGSAPGPHAPRATTTPGAQGVGVPLDSSAGGASRAEVGTLPAARAQVTGRAVRLPPVVLMDPEDDLERQRAVKELLPHVAPDDLGKLGHYCPADLDKNDVIDGGDVAMFVQLWGDETHPLGDWADLNRDGLIDADDAIEFVRLYSDEPCDTQRQRELRGMIC